MADLSITKSSSSSSSSAGAAATSADADDVAGGAVSDEVVLDEVDPREHINIVFIGVYMYIWLLLLFYDESIFTI